MNLHPIAVLLLLTIPVFASAQRKTLKGIVIPVDSVIPAKEPYNTFNQKKVLEQANAKTMLVHSTFPEKIVPGSTDGFINTIHLAYAQHHDLVLSPDDIWIQIALSVSIHINEQFDKLNPLVVTSPKKEEIFVRMDDLAKMEEKDWQQLADTFTVLAKAKMQPAFYKTMLPEFTTSTAETRTVMNIILLSSIKQSIGLHGASGCGIPNIILTGDKKDWEKILSLLGELEQYDLKFWTDELKPVIQEFINAFDGKADKQFWQRIYKYREGYMLEQMNGWASKFFPYFVTADYIQDPAEIAAFEAENPETEYEMLTRNRYFVNPHLKGDDYMLYSIDLESLPASICSIPLTWNNLFSENPEDQEQHLTIYAGFIGARQQESGWALQNNPVWFIVRSDDYLERDYDHYMVPTQKQADFASRLWSDEIASNPKYKAVYNPAKNKHGDGYDELLTEILTYFTENFPNEKLKGTKLTFTVSHSGMCINPEILGGDLSGVAKAELLLRMKKLHYSFRPAMIPMQDAEPQLEVVEDGPALIPANSPITIIF